MGGKGEAEKPAKSKTATLINGFTKDELSKEQLEEHIVRLREELDREREERNYFQLERDKIHTFWEVTDRKQQEVKAELKKLDKDMEEDEARHQEDIKVHKQKGKHLQHEHLNTIAQLNANSLATNDKLQNEQKKLEKELHNTTRALRADMKKLHNKDETKELELKGSEEMTTAMNQWEKQLKEMKASRKKEMELLQQKFDNMKKQDLSDREHQWNSHIAILNENHNKAFSHIEVIVALIRKDLDEISRLELQIKEIKKKQTGMKAEMVTVLQNNKRLAELISNVEEQNNEIYKPLKYYPEQKNLIENFLKKALKDLKSKHEVLEQKFSKLQLETNELYKSFNENIEKVWHKTDVKNLLMEKKVHMLTENLEKTQAQLSVILSASNMDQTALSDVTNRTEGNIDSRNSAIKNLQHEINLISRSHRDLLLYIEAMERALSVPVEELLCKSP